MSSIVCGVSPNRAGGLPIVDERGLEAAVLLIAVDVGQCRQLPHLLKQNRSPPGQVIEVVALDRVLILRVTRPAADAQVLRWIAGRATRRARVAS